MAGPRQTTLPLGDAPAPSTPRSDPPPPPPPDVAPLSAALEAALLRELARVHESDSWAHFGSRLRAPVFELVDSATRLGRWVHATRTIELARALVLERPWPDVVAVLQHEMAHQYVDEVLGVRDESAHGDTFRRVPGPYPRKVRRELSQVFYEAAARDVDDIYDLIEKLERAGRSQHTGG